MCSSDLAADGADLIVPAADGRGVRARWTQWAVVGGKAGERIDPGLQSDVEWTLEGDTLVRTERLTAARPLRAISITAGSFSIPVMLRSASPPSRWRPA